MRIDSFSEYLFPHEALALSPWTQFGCQEARGKSVELAASSMGQSGQRLRRELPLPPFNADPLMHLSSGHGSNGFELRATGLYCVNPITA